MTDQPTTQPSQTHQCCQHRHFQPALFEGQVEGVPPWRTEWREAPLTRQTQRPCCTNATPKPSPEASPGNMEKAFHWERLQPFDSGLDPTQSRHWTHQHTPDHPVQTSLQGLQHWTGKTHRWHHLYCQTTYMEGWQVHHTHGTAFHEPHLPKSHPAQLMQQPPQDSSLVDACDKHSAFEHQQSFVYLSGQISTQKIVQPEPWSVVWNQARIFLSVCDTGRIEHPCHSAMSHPSMVWSPHVQQPKPVSPQATAQGTFHAPANIVTRHPVATAQQALALPLFSWP